MTEWTTWDGNGYPDIDPHKPIEVKFRDGSTDAMDAGAWVWGFNWAGREPTEAYDIVAFRDTDWRPTYSQKQVEL